MFESSDPSKGILCAEPTCPDDPWVPYPYVLLWPSLPLLLAVAVFRLMLLCTPALRCLLARCRSAYAPPFPLVREPASRFHIPVGGSLGGSLVGLLYELPKVLPMSFGVNPLRLRTP